MSIRYFEMIKPLCEDSEQRAAAPGHGLEILFCTTGKPPPSASLSNGVSEHVRHFAGNVRWGGRLGRSCVHCDKSPSSATHCYMVPLGRASVLKTCVHVCSNFALKSMWAVREAAVHTALGRVCVDAVGIVTPGHLQ